MEKIPKDIKIEILSFCEDKDLIEFSLTSKYYYRLLSSSEIWTRKNRGANLVRYGKKLKPIAYSAKNNYFRNLIAQGKYVPMIGLTHPNYLLRLAIIENDMSGFKKLLCHADLDSASFLGLGLVAIYLERYNYLQIIMQITKTLWFEWFFCLGFNGFDLGDFEPKGVISNLVRFTKGLEPLEQSNREVLLMVYGHAVRFSIKHHGLEKTKELFSPVLNNHKLDCAIIWAMVFLDQDLMENPEWERFINSGNLPRFLAVSGNLRIFLKIIDYLKKIGSDRHVVNYLFTLLPSTNPIYGYIISNYNLEYHYLELNVLSDLVAWRYLVEHVTDKCLVKFYNKEVKNIQYEEVQIVIREIKKRGLTV